MGEKKSVEGNQSAAVFCANDSWVKELHLQLWKIAACCHPWTKAVAFYKEGQRFVAIAWNRVMQTGLVARLKEMQKDQSGTNMQRANG